MTIEARRRALPVIPPARNDTGEDAAPWVRRVAAVLLAACLLYLLIGPSPWAHQKTLDPDTGGAVMSPINRYVWFALLGLSAPVLWARRAELPGLLARSWLLLVLLAWFAVTTTWAIDRSASQRRLILLLCQTVAAAACCLGLRGPRAMHAAMAAACAVLVAVDLASWLAAPGASMTEIGLAAIHNHKNSLGLAMLLVEMVCLPLAVGAPGRTSRLLWAGVALGGFALLVASQSKTSLFLTLALLVAGPALIAVLSLRRPTLSGLVVVSLLAPVLATFAWLGWNAVQGADPLKPIRGLTFTQRTDVWSFVLDQAALRPWRGVGFASFWDVDPGVQPSLQTDYWFAQPNSPTNEAHDGYLDILVTTGVVGLALAATVLIRWIAQGFARLREALLSPAADARAARPYLLVLAVLPPFIALHNLTESSYFNTVGVFSFVAVLLGLDVDLRRPAPPASPRPRLAPRPLRNRHAPP